MDEIEQVRQEQERHMYLLHRNVNGLRANLDLAQTVAATKVQNHLNDNQNLLKEVNNLRFEVRGLSMENQRLTAQLEFNARMAAGRNNGSNNNNKRGSASPPAGGSHDGGELMFPQYQQPYQSQQNQQQLSPNQQHQQHQLQQYGGSHDNDRDTISTNDINSQDSNELRNDAAEYFIRMRDGSRGDAAGGAGGAALAGNPMDGGVGSTAHIRQPGVRGAVAKKMNKASSTPFFSVKAVHSDPVAEAARNTLAATAAPLSFEERRMQQQDSLVSSKRTIAGVPSFHSQSQQSFLQQQSQQSLIQSQHSFSDFQQGGSLANSVTNKNEFVRSADDKIAALMQMNTMQIAVAMKKEESEVQMQGQQGSRAAASSSSSAGAGAANKGGLGVAKGGKVKPYTVKAENSLELQGAPAPAMTADVGGDWGGLNLSLASSEGSSALQLPNIKRNAARVSITAKRK